MRRAALLALLVCACGKPVFVDPRAEPYAKRFTEATGVDASGVSIAIVAMTGPYIGYCDGGPTSVDPPVVELSEEYWNDNPQDYPREALVFHELGHCAMDLPHDTTRVIWHGESVAASIMYPHAIGSTDFYESMHADYLEALRRRRAITQSEADLH